MIRLENISLYSGQRKRKNYLLKDINLVLPGKGLVVITGSDANATSALVNIIGAMERADTGKVFYRGEKLSGSKYEHYRAGVSYLFQKYFYFTGTVEEYFNMQKGTIQKQEVNLLPLLEKVNFKGNLREQVLYLNAGELMKVNIMQALIKDPEVIIATEPTSGLSSEEETEIMEILQEIAKERLLVIATNKQSLFKYADRVIEIEQVGVINDSAPLEEKKYAVKSALKKKKLSFSFTNVFRIIYENLKRRQFYTIIFMLLTIIFLSFYFTADVSNEFDGPGLILEMMEEHEIDYGEIYKIKVNYFVYVLEMSKEDVEKVVAENPNYNYYKVLDFKHDYLFPDSKGIVELPENHEEFTFLYGSYPEATNEFFVTESYAKALLRWTQLLGKMYLDIEDLIGYTLPDYGNLKLTGIVEDGIWDNYVYVTSGYLDLVAPELSAQGRGYCSYLYLKITDNKEDNYKLFSMYHGDYLYFIDPSKEFVIKNPVTTAVFPSAAVYYTMSDHYYNLSKYLFIIPLILAVFLIPRALIVNRRDFWLKRLLGYRNREFIAAFIIQMLLLFAIIVPISCIIGISFVQTFETKSVQMIYSFYDVNIFNVLKLVGFALIFTILSVIIPIYKFSGSFPFDTIKQSPKKQASGKYYLDVRFLD